MTLIIGTVGTGRRVEGVTRWRQGELDACSNRPTDPAWRDSPGQFEIPGRTQRKVKI